MKLPTNDVSLIKLLDRVLTALGLPEWFIVKLKQEREAFRKWYKSDQKFIVADSFATGGGVKALNGKAIKRPGNYYYSHKITKKCVYIGWTNNLYNRTNTAKTVARSLIETGGPPPQTIYPAIEKMIAEDPKLENWIISYMETFSITIAIAEEERMILEERPAFNNLAMAGK